MWMPYSHSIVLTVGHSTRSLGEFILLLVGHSVTQLIDVRTVPRSRHNPQFNPDTLRPALESAGIHYAHVAGLGGFRRTHSGSLNLGWRNASFRGFADYMQTEEFADNLADLIERAKRDRIVLMCAEAVPWRCHRSLISDALVPTVFARWRSLTERAYKCTTLHLSPAWTDHSSPIRDKNRHMCI